MLAPSPPPPVRAPLEPERPARAADWLPEDYEVLAVRHLVKHYGDVRAVDGVSFAIRPGEVFGLVGPNGAGKTTTIECLVGLRQPDGGEVRVLGMDPLRERKRLFARVGVQLQDNGMYSRITVREALRLYASMYEAPRAPRELLEQFGLTRQADTQFRRLSGGERRRLLTAIALIGAPDLVLLDEPTSGLDPHARRAMWAALDAARRDGLAILLSTHDMQEAQERADVVCILNRGRVVASGAPAALLRAHGLETRVSAPTASPPSASALERCPGLTRVERAAGEVYLFGEGAEFTPTAVALLDGLGLREITTRPAGLEDLYLMLTGDPYADRR
jgi:ABC-2 type transport system ATP-binding protein